MNWLTLGTFTAGLLLLIGGGELLVRGASRLAARLGVPSLLIGLTVVAYGTSAPELAVSLQAARAGSVDIALGNVVGSSIFNVLFILGISALITPLVVARQLVWLDVPIMIGVAALLLVFALDGRISRLEGLLLAVGLVAYTAFLLYESRQAPPPAANGKQEGVRRGPLPVLIGMIVGGLALLVLGARWLLAAAVAIAAAVGLSEAVIGLTIVAVGTSLPEIVTSIVAALRGERDIAVGNVVGSNITNVLGIAGLTALLTPGGLDVAPALLRFDLPVLLAVVGACLPVVVSGHRIDRWEGALFFAYYVAYTFYLILDATGHDALPAFSAVMLEFVLPLTLITLLVVMVRALRQPRGR